MRKGAGTDIFASQTSCLKKDKANKPQWKNIKEDNPNEGAEECGEDFARCLLEETTYPLSKYQRYPQ